MNGNGAEYPRMVEAWKKVLPMPSCAVLTGFRGAGKSALGYWLLEALSSEYAVPAYVVGLPRPKWPLLPPEVQAVDSIKGLPANAIIFIDEASLTFHAREWGDRKHIEADRLMALSRQRNQVLLLATHHTRKLDVNLITDTGALLCKRPSTLQARLDRAEVRPFVVEAAEAFRKLPGGADHRQHTYVFDFMRDRAEMLKNPAPSFWTEDLSRAFGMDEAATTAEPEEPVVDLDAMLKASMERRLRLQAQAGVP